jgi:hypothetical protein
LSYIYLLPIAVLLLAPSSGTGKASVAGNSTQDAAVTAVALKQFAGQLGITRRIIRTFRFLDAFNSAHTLYTSATAAPLPLTSWLDVAGFSFNGMYLFLEAIATIDTLNIPGLAIWGSGYAQILKIESQRSWFFALLANGLACALRLYQMQAERHLLIQSSSTDEKAVEKPKPGSIEEEKSADKGESVEASKLEQLDAKMRTTGRKLIASALDLVLPGSVVGWTPVSPGIVASAMSVTSLLTGYEVWKRLNK